MKEMYGIVLLAIVCTKPFYAMELSTDESSLVDKIDQVATKVINESLKCRQRKSLYENLPKNFKNGPDALLMHVSIARCLATSFAPTTKKTFIPTNQALIRFNEALGYIERQMPLTPALLTGMGYALSHCYLILQSAHLREYYADTDICSVEEAELLKKSHRCLCNIYQTICIGLSDKEPEHNCEGYQFNLDIYNKLQDNPYNERFPQKLESTPTIKGPLSQVEHGVVHRSFTALKNLCLSSKYIALKTIHRTRLRH
jgi:hypothetical protein